MYKWYTNGKVNKRIFENQPIPEGFREGYLLKQDQISKMKRLRKLNEKYEKKKLILKLKYERALEELDKELLNLQKQIVDF